MNNDLYTLISTDVDLRKAAGTHGGEYAGACPFCGGRDRFRVWPNDDRPAWWCRQCEKGGDAIQYLREKGYTFQDACAALGVVKDRPGVARLPFVPPLSCEAPPQAWRAAGSGFVLWSQAELQGAPHARDYLTSRGLTKRTIDAAGLGYNPASRECSRAKWGLESDKERGDKFWLPAGIVIPWYVAGTLWKIQIRRDVVSEAQDRYKTITGSSNALYYADALTAGKPAMLVEGPFDALAVRQAAGDLIGVAACGTSGARRARWLTKLALCGDILVSLDADAAGDAASGYWLNVAAGARRWRPWYADPAQMLQDGQDVRRWVLAGLGMVEPDALPLSGAPLDYWREEVRQGCAVSLDRLRRICQQRGADYDKTVEALR
jgi:hypothetical protein